VSSQSGDCCSSVLLLLFEAGSWGTGTVREARTRGTSAVGSHYQKKTGEDTEDWKDLRCAVVNCKECELAIALELLVVTFCRWSVNAITNLNPVCSHQHTWQYAFLIVQAVITVMIQQRKWNSQGTYHIQIRGGNNKMVIKINWVKTSLIGTSSMNWDYLLTYLYSWALHEKPPIVQLLPNYTAFLLWSHIDEKLFTI
jgi:hypothetical protein